MKGLCSPFALLLLAVLGCLARRSSLVNGHGIARRGVDGPGSDNFIRHRYPAVVAFGDHLYIDGGEVFSKSNGTGTNSTQSSGSYPSYAINGTFSLRLNESWTNDTVEFRTIPKTAPLLSQQIYWSDTDNAAGAFYTWGGMAVGSASPPENSLWIFRTDGTGGGQWSQVTQGDYLAFSRLRRPTGSAFTQGGGVGYALGGQVYSKTDRSVQEPAPGYALTSLISYDFDSGNWGNDSSASYGGYGTCLNGRAEFIPFGPNGLLLFLGGAETLVDIADNHPVQVTWNLLWMVDPVTKKWYKQTTKGTRPVTVEGACTVGARGPNNTYEIFIYGGSSTQTEGVSADVYVLSLPGFYFFKADSPGTPRADHACVTIGKGKRQMLSYGGVDGGSGLVSSTMTPDPWKQGLGIYDMSELKWLDSYDPSTAAADYESPAIVTDWYKKGGMESVAWDGDVVKALFINGSSGTYGEPNNTTTGSPDDSQQQSSRRIGAIVGGTVGGVVGLTIAGVGIFFLLRRRRRRQSTKAEAAATIEEYRPEPWPKDSPRMRSTTPGTLMTFMSGPTPEPVEISGTAREELPAEDVDWTYELPVPTPRLRPELPDRKFSI